MIRYQESRCFGTGMQPGRPGDCSRRIPGKPVTILPSTSGFVGTISEIRTHVIPRPSVETFSSDPDRRCCVKSQTAQPYRTIMPETGPSRISSVLEDGSHGIRLGM